MVARGRTIEPDDLSYALVLWKYLAVYALVRFTVTPSGQVRVVPVGVASARPRGRG